MNTWSGKLSCDCIFLKFWNDEFEGWWWPTKDLAMCGLQVALEQHPWWLFVESAPSMAKNLKFIGFIADTTFKALSCKMHYFIFDLLLTNMRQNSSWNIDSSMWLIKLPSTHGIFFPSYFSQWNLLSSWESNWYLIIYQWSEWSSYPNS